MTAQMEVVPPVESLAVADRYAVYRCFSDLGQLLYVGSTGRLGKRLGTHSEKVWFLQVRGITLEWYPTELDALSAERRAIHVEHPKYNAQLKTTPLAQPTRQFGKPAGERRRKSADRSEWPETKDISPGRLRRMVEMAAAKWEREHDGARLPALQLGAQMRVRMSRNTATALLRDHYRSATGSARGSAQG